MVFESLPGALQVLLEGLLRSTWSLLGASWTQLGASWPPLGANLEPLGSHLEPLGCNLEPLGFNWEPLGVLLDRTWRLRALLSLNLPLPNGLPVQLGLHLGLPTGLQAEHELLLRILGGPLEAARAAITNRGPFVAPKELQSSTAAAC